MTREDAIEYLEQVLDHWTSWHEHYHKLVRAIEILLEDAKNEGQGIYRRTIWQHSKN